MKRHTKANPCAVCGGSADDPQGHGRRCFGFLSDDGGWAHCSREELAGGIKQHKDDTYVHKLAGKCACGIEHGHADVTPIGDAARSIVATYDYTNALGVLLYQVVRMHPKTFRQRKPDGQGGWTWKLDGLQPVIYRLPEVRAGVAAGDTVWIVEGEKDVEALRVAGQVATCNSGGAGKWRDTYSQELAGAAVVIVRDKDEPGTDHARKVFASVRHIAASVRVVEARVGKDAADHLAAGHGVGDFVQVYPLADLREADPVAWKRRALRMSLDASEPMREASPNEAMQRPAAPSWPTGLRGDEPLYAMPSLSGVVIAAGIPSTGKSYFAIGSAVDAARAGWDVIYLSCEMSDRTISERILAASNGAVPETFHLVSVGYGASVDGLITWIERAVTERNTLIVFDSVSSFCDQAEKSDTDDPYGVEMLKRLVMWAVNCRVATEGQIAFVLLAEASKEGRMRGRTGDHKADLSLLFESDKATPQSKRISVVKAWASQTGPLGFFHLNHVTARLEKL